MPKDDAAWRKALDGKGDPAAGERLFFHALIAPVQRHAALFEVARPDFKVKVRNGGQTAEFHATPLEFENHHRERRTQAA